MPVTSAQPVPDCQPENCAGLRIIDGNAEAFHVDAMRRAGQDSQKHKKSTPGLRRMCLGWYLY
jgi:hypothetical protein